MTAFLFALAVVALVVYGLERNHRRQTTLGSRLAGSTEVEDRDLPRVRLDLQATARHPAAHRPRTARHRLGHRARSNAPDRLHRQRPHTA